MSLIKENLCLQCESCHYSGGEHGGSFQLEVPIEDVLTGRKGTAFIECEVMENKHHLTLLYIQDPTGFEMKLSAEERRRLEKVLDMVAGKKLCGNKGICPEEVVLHMQSVGKS